MYWIQGRDRTQRGIALGRAEPRERGVRPVPGPESLALDSPCLMPGITTAS